MNKLLMNLSWSKSTKLFVLHHTEGVKSILYKIGEWGDLPIYQGIHRLSRVTWVEVETRQ